MSKIELLLGMVQDIRSLADKIQSFCEALNENDSAIESKPDEPKERQPHNEITLEEVRAVLAEKSQLGMTADVRKIIQKYGARKLSEVSNQYYAAIMKDAEVLGNG